MASYLKNMQFSRVGIMQGDGTMVVLGPREEVDASQVNLEEPHVKSLLGKGYLSIRDKQRKGSEAEAKARRSKTTAGSPEGDAD